MRGVRVLLLLLVCMGVAAPVLAQADGYAFTGINFNFTNPGARARGIGGAFVAIADDSTAALANPAGIAYLTREVSIEGAIDEDEFLVGQLTQGEVSVVNDVFVETYTAEADPYRVAAVSDEGRLNYGSVVLPIIRNKLTFAAYYAVLGDMASSFTVPEGLFCVSGADGRAWLPGAGEQCVNDFLDPQGTDRPTLYFDQEVSFSLSTKLYGGAIGYRVNDALSLGLSLAYAETVFSSSATVVRPQSELRKQQLTSIDDSDLVYSLGILYRRDLWGFGISYRSSSGYRTENLDLWLEDQPSVANEFNGTFTVPERLAFGVALFPSDSWVVSAEVDRIPYSDVLAEMPTFSRSIVRAGDIEYRISDVTEYHLGLEYTTFAERRGWSIRLGYWRDTSHLPWVDEPYQDAREEGDGLRAQESTIRARFDEHVNHLTAGVGLSLGSRLRLDAAVDHTGSSGIDFLLSGVVYF